MARVLVFASLVAACTVLATAATAQPALEGYFIALSECAANKKKDSDNPGNVHLQMMHAYEMLARNATPGTHYQVKENVVTTKPGATIMLLAINATVRARWCEVFSC